MKFFIIMILMVITYKLAVLQQFTKERKPY